MDNTGRTIAAMERGGTGLAIVNELLGYMRERLREFGYVEIKTPLERVEEVIGVVWEVEKQISTVVAIGVGAMMWRAAAGVVCQRQIGQPRARARPTRRRM
mgnify:CR=1 FL=1